MESQYRYIPLPPAPERGEPPPFTRLLMLWPGTPDDSLACSLQVLDIRNAPRYEALSYTWGKEPAQASIWVDRKPLLVKPNLEAALCNLRLRTQARWLWIDALCIDQSNMSERARQIRYMRLVYQHSARAIVWLGHETREVESAFALAENLHEFRQNYAMRDSLYNGVHNTQVVNKETGWAILLTMTEDLPDDAWECLQHVLKRDYFERCWCIQEVIVSPWAVAKCGSREIPFFHLLAGAKDFIVDEILSRPLAFWDAVYATKFNASVNEAPSAIKGSSGSLLKLLVRTRNFKSTDPRDKLYSLLGISDEGIEPAYCSMHVMKAPTGLKKLLWGSAMKLYNLGEKYGVSWDSGTASVLIPNYNRSVVEIYRDFARFWLTKTPMHLEILSYVYHDEDFNSSEYPSWVPQWSETYPCSSLASEFFAAGIYGSGPDFSVVHDNPAFGHPVHPGTLSLDGICFDRIHSVTELADTWVSNSIPIARLWNQLFESSPLDSRYQDGDYLIRALCLRRWPYSGET